MCEVISHCFLVVLVSLTRKLEICNDKKLLIVKRPTLGAFCNDESMIKRPSLVAGDNQEGRANPRTLKKGEIEGPPANIEALLGSAMDPKKQETWGLHLSK